MNLPGTFNQQVTTQPVVPIQQKPEIRKTNSSQLTAGSDKKSQVAIDLENIFKQLQKQQSTGFTAKRSGGPPTQDGFSSGDEAGKKSKSKGKKNLHSSDEEDGGEDFFKTNTSGS